VAGVSIRFIIPGLDTPWQRSEDLGWKDRTAKAADPRAYEYAPNGLLVTQVREHLVRHQLGGRPFIQR